MGSNVLTLVPVFVVPNNSSTTENPRKETTNGDFGLIEVPLDPEGASTPPPELHTVTPGKSLSTKGKEVSSGGNDESGYVCIFIFNATVRYAYMLHSS